MSQDRKNHPHYPSPYTSAGGHKEPLSKATAGKLYRVRDEHKAGPDGTQIPGKLWGDKLPYDRAVKLKEETCGKRKSTNALIEDMVVPYPPRAPAPPPVVVAPPPSSVPDPVPATVPAVEDAPDAAAADALLDELGESGADIDDLIGDAS